MLSFQNKSVNKLKKVLDKTLPEVVNHTYGLLLFGKAVQIVSVKSNTACVPHTLHVDFKVCTARRYGVWRTTHAVGKDASYSLLFSKTQPTVS